MSFILDALRKSENERQQSSNAEFASVPTGPRPASFPRWLLVVGVLLAINLVVLIGLLLRQDSKPEEIVRFTQPASETVPTAAAESQITRPSFEEQVAAVRKNPPTRQPEPAADEPETDSMPNVQAVLISQNPASVTPRQLYPTLQEVRANGALDLPDLHLDIHVFSDVPKDRFVFINMAKHREGSRLDEGPQVTEITPDGVVLRYQGKSFLVPRE